MSDRQNLPRPAPEVSEDGVSSIEEGALPPLDRPQAVTDWGTTASEQLASEPLDVRLAREEPDVLVGDTEADRQFLEPGAYGGLLDDEADSFGEMNAGFEDTLSAEEAAMRVVDEPPGMNYDPDPGYIDRDRF